MPEPGPCGDQGWLSRAVTFARIDHSVEEGEIPGVVVARVNMSQKFTKELMEALNDSWSKYSTMKGIKDLPETPEQT